MISCNHKSISLFIVATLFFSVSGCGSKKLPLISVQGKVKWKGDTLRSGQISFHPLKATPNMPHRNAIGTIDEKGNYLLTTLRKDDGILPGEYAVVVVSFVKGSKAHTFDEEPEILVPKKYIQASTTPLRATVPANSSGPLTLDFEIRED